MLRCLTQIEIGSPDWKHVVSETLLIPLSTLFGHSYRIENSAIERLAAESLLRRVQKLALAIVLFPLTLVGAAIGVFVLHFSKTHRNAYRQIRDSFVQITWNGHRPEIRTKELLIRPIQEGDRPGYKAFSKVYAEADKDFDDIFGEWLKNWKEHPFSALAIIDPSNNQLVGHTGLTQGRYEGNDQSGWSFIDMALKPEFEHIRKEVLRGVVVYAKELQKKDYQLPTLVSISKEGSEWTHPPFTQIRKEVPREKESEYEIFKRVLTQENNGMELNLPENKACFALNLAPCRKISLH